MKVPPELLFQTSTIAHGNMSLRFGEDEAVIKNRDQFVGHHNYVCMRCNHGDQIVTVDAPAREQIDAEVLVTQTPNLCLMLLTADCLPTALYDPITQTIALAHFSRQTIAAGLPEETIGFLRQSLQVDPINLQVLVGPHIHPTSYCFPAPLEEVKPRIEAHLVERGDHVCINLPAAHTAQLTGAGVQEENIQYSPVDTFASPEHFSHFESTRNNTKPHGRLATSLTLLSSS